MFNWFKKNNRKNSPGAMILMYHRIALLSNDPWNLAVSPHHFEDQLKTLKQNHTILHLSELKQALSAGVQNPIAISFDDGYADNFHVAMPLLDKYAIPASFFICTGLIGTDNIFWWDWLQLIFLESPVLPTHLDLALAKQTIEFEFSGEEVLFPALTEKLHCWRYPESTDTKRSAAFLAIWQHMKTMSILEQASILLKLRNWSAMQNIDIDRYRLMTETDIKKMAAHPLFSIGAHTVNHPPLSLCSMEMQRKEIRDSRDYLAHLTGKKITQFAYPFGDYNTQTADLAGEENFQIAVTTNHQLVHQHTPDFTLGRYLVEDIPGIELSGFIHNILKNN